MTAHEHPATKRIRRLLEEELNRLRDDDSPAARTAAAQVATGATLTLESGRIEATREALRQAGATHADARRERKRKDARRRRREKRESAAARRDSA